MFLVRVSLRRRQNCAVLALVVRAAGKIVKSDTLIGQLAEIASEVRFVVSNSDVEDNC